MTFQVLFYRNNETSNLIAVTFSDDGTISMSDAQGNLYTMIRDEPRATDQSTGDT